MFKNVSITTFEFVIPLMIKNNGGWTVSKNKMEELLGLGPIENHRIVPGIQPIEGREFCYIADEGQEDFVKIFRKIVRYISPPIPQNGGAMIEGCKITLPNGKVFQAISYKGDIEGWRMQIEKGARALNVNLAKIDGESIVLDNIHSFLLMDCRIDFN